ncbi:hypothetical protein [Aliikangiella coralliicola]|uniref:Uncharacterized protein n=1 Tax=Aliikangiella coralliicola TaxID=2592383 RepID=A0A545U8N5_9GAMM|nr:hypothetical protein [Aliikangiella coralliicola]TQV85826.1 hypothetical protein FLL46_18035 [Aliikangiella coralliicola]
MNSNRIADELNRLTELHKELVIIAEKLRIGGDSDNSKAVLEVAFGLQSSQLNILTSMVNDPTRTRKKQA